jgi:hypothetical protein
LPGIAKVGMLHSELRVPQLKIVVLPILVATRQGVLFSFSKSDN